MLESPIILNGVNNDSGWRKGPGDWLRNRVRRAENYKKRDAITQDNISSLLENKRAEVDDVLHKLLLKGTAQLIRNGFEN